MPSTVAPSSPVRAPPPAEISPATVPPLAPLPQALLQLVNAPSAPATTVPRSDVLIAQIAPHDATLCRLMSRQPGTQRARNTARAQTLIELTEPMRQELAQRTADSLRHWLHEDGRHRFAVRGERLQNRIQSAGLNRILALLPVSMLSAAQRQRIGELLRDIGAHTPTLRAALHLQESELAGIQPITLRDRLMSLGQQERLQRGGQGRHATRNLRADTFQHAKMVGRRFGYPNEHPPWDFMAARRQDVPRVALLCRLAGLSTARRCGIDVQLP